MKSSRLFAYVGSYTTPERQGRGNGINVYSVDPRRGTLGHVQHLGGLENPSFLALNAAGTHLYSVHGDRSEATSYTIDPQTGRIAILNRQPTGGFNPIHLAFDAQARFLIVSNYGSDSIAALPIERDGALGPYSTLTAIKAPLGPHRREQTNVRPHHNPLDRTGRFFYLPCKGADCVIGYRLDRRRGVLVEASRVAARPVPVPAISTSIRPERSPTSSTNSTRRSRPIARTVAAAGSHRYRRSHRRPPTSLVTAPVRKSGSIVLAAPSTSPTAATTVSASSP